MAELVREPPESYTPTDKTPRITKHPAGVEHTGRYHRLPVLNTLVRESHRQVADPVGPKHAFYDLYTGSLKRPGEAKHPGKMRKIPWRNETPRETASNTLGNCVKHPASAKYPGKMGKL
jgi:hypothetical protein